MVWDEKARMPPWGCGGRTHERQRARTGRGRRTQEAGERWCGMKRRACRPGVVVAEHMKGRGRGQGEAGGHRRQVSDGVGLEGAHAALSGSTREAEGGTGRDRGVWMTDNDFEHHWVPR
jgi:hypothetical protein